jgi:tetratricopeptide (TPR) repeat protein/predicted Ser/Thr protein kinase
MNPERFQRIEELYHTARQKTAEERAVLLASLDPDLRSEVESLLSERSGGEFLDRPALENVPQLFDDLTLTGTASGATLGPYRIESKLGEGGMGEVYRAIDTRLDRAVAIKTAREQFSARFEREARTIASLNHPNICTLYDVGPNYLVMELVEGETIAARLKSGPIPVHTALVYASQILAALAEAHGKGITHRDLKPGNIMIAKSGIKVLDFGLAKSGQDETITASRMVMGTPAYMAPEQREGKQADARSDIYSFGCVLHEMLTGARASSLRKRLPSPKLEGIVNRCLEEDPALRWQSVAELERELSAAPAVARGGRRNAMAIVLAALIVAGLSIAGWLFFMRERPALTDKDTIVLANFANRTGDPIFDGTLRQGLSVQLEQSPFLSLVSDDRIQQTLRMMGRKPDAKLTPEIALDLCQRVGSAAVIEGSIAQVGSPYLLTLKAVNCASGETLASTEAQASDKNQVLDALGKASSEIRRKLGESLSTVRKFNTPLEQATTPSLEALRAFSLGIRYDTTNGGDAAIPFLKRAIKLDPKFALAYAWLGIESTDMGEPGLAAAYTRKAYELRDRASDPEKYFISAVYHKEATGNMEEAEQSCKQWILAYPRASMPHVYLSAAIYPALGEYEKAAEQAREAVRLDPASSFTYQFLVSDYIALGRLDEAKATYQRAIERKLNSPFYLMALYGIAFLRNDATGMARQVSQSVGKPEVEDQILAAEADTAAYSGELEKARELSRQAMDSAGRSGKKETVATYSAIFALREALFGNAEEARRRAALAMEDPAGHDVQYGAALALAFAGDEKHAQTLTAGLARRFPEDTLTQFNYLPTLRAELAIRKGDPAEALDDLRTAAPYELGKSTFSGYPWIAMYPVYVRGQAYLAAHQGSQAVAEFQKILDHRGIVVNEPIGALAHLQIARAYAMEGETAKARTAYKAFLTLWKNADPDIPILNQARSEYAKLQGASNSAQRGNPAVGPSGFIAGAGR